ncbi:MAG TPA: glycosyltransferase 87 family protein [Candidatus Dormibacteraeota bacterium]
MRGRARRWLIALGLALALAGCAAVITQSSESRQAADFTFYYSAALLVRDGDAAAAYDQSALQAAIKQVAPESAVDRRLPFNLPLAAVLPLVPLTLLPLELAFRAWQLISLGLLVLALLLLARSYPLGRGSFGLGLLAILASVPLWSVITEAQLTPLLLLGGVLVLSAAGRDLPWAAFAGGLLLAVKPHFLPAYLLILLAARHRRSLLAAIAGGALMLMSPLAAGGVPVLAAMIRNALSTNGLVPIRLSEAWIGLVAAFVPGAATQVSLVLYLLALLLLAVVAIRRADTMLAPFAAIALWVGMLASPHVLPHDLLLLAIPGWLAIWLYREGRLPSPLIGLLLVDLALLLDSRGIGFVLGPIVMTAAAAWAFWRFRQRADRLASQHKAVAA